jgi:putative intracellular protease/amidase
MTDVAAEIASDSNAYDAMVIPGGFAPDYMRRNEHMKAAIVTMLQAGKPVAAICHGPWMFCSARKPGSGEPLIAGLECTAFVAIQDDLVNAGAKFVDAPVVVSAPVFDHPGGVIITSRTPADLTPFCRTIIDVVATGTPEAQKKAEEAPVPAAITAMVAGGLSEEEARLVGQRNNFDLKGRRVS